MKKKIKVLDVTLRDGGCINNFNFGMDYMQKILHAQETAQIDIIEVGYIDEIDGAEIGRTKYINDRVITQHFILQKQEGVEYVAMIDYGKFNPCNLQERSKKTIDGIRMAFHKDNCYDMLKMAKNIMAKGYNFYIQPMITTRYSDSELLELITKINEEIPEAKGFYIVDSFGEMRPNDMLRMINLVDHNLTPSMALGFHSHNNLQLSYSNAISMISFPTTRELIIDASIMGMGKGAGNLNTELLLEHLNLSYGAEYQIEPLLDVIDKVINQLHNEFYWGYAPEFYLSSAHHCTPNYASYYYNKHMLPISKVGELLSLLDENKKISFDKDYAEKIYRKYNENQSVDDAMAVAELKKEFFNKEVLLIAPGKSIGNSLKKITDLSKKENVITIGLNSTLKINYDYLLLTREDIYTRAINEGMNIIIPSNVSKDRRENVKVLNYAEWIEFDEETYDSSFVIVMKLLMMCNTKTIYLAGLDGFSTDINKNYYDSSMRRPINEEQAERYNNYYRGLINRVRKRGINIRFITASKYQLGT